MLYFAFIGLFITIIQGFLTDDTRRMLNIDTEDSSIEVDEDLPNFFDTIMFTEARKVVAEYEHM